MSLRERNLIETALLGNLIFSNLTDNLRAQVLNQMELFEFKEGTTIYE
jgi:hypothetical protein